MTQQRGAPASTRTRVRRHPERATYDRDSVLEILDEGLICHLGFVADGTPFVMPTMYARHGDVIYIHGSPLSRMLRSASGAAEVCLTVTLLDGLVFARAAFHHSMNYRSVVVVGRAEEVTDREEKLAASVALLEHVCRGRSAEARHPNQKELDTTTVLRLPIDEASAKVREGGPKDSEADVDLPVWAGYLPLAVRPLQAVRHEASDQAVPAYVSAYTRPGWTE